jgi:putative sterol carrier protein
LAIGAFLDRRRAGVSVGRLEPIRYDVDVNVTQAYCQEPLHEQSLETAFMVEDILSEMRARSATLRSLNASVRFVLGKDGEIIHLDARSNPIAITQDDQDADCTIRISPENLAKLINGKLNPMLAFTMGKLKVEGSMGVAMKLAQLLDE